jgi:hypothetical protein
MTPFKQSLSVTGFILFILGIATLTPEIYLSGVMVMVTSAGLTIKALEDQRADAISPETIPTYETYGSW